MEKKKIRYIVYGTMGGYRGSVTRHYKTRVEAKDAIERVRGYVKNPRVKKIKVGMWMT